jgi:hypothetical protein
MINADAENWCYQIKTRVSDSDWASEHELRHWLRLHIGEPYLDWVTGPLIAYSGGYSVAVKLKREEDAVMVALRWS